MDATGDLGPLRVTGVCSGFSSIVFNNGSTAITYGGVTETLFHPGVTLSLANDVLVI